MLFLDDANVVQVFKNAGKLNRIIKNQGFKNWKSWYMFFHTPNNMFAYTIMHLTFCAPQIVVHPSVFGRE